MCCIIHVVSAIAAKLFAEHLCAFPDLRQRSPYASINFVTSIKNGNDAVILKNGM